jgi:hypothetical protein
MKALFQPFILVPEEGVLALWTSWTSPAGEPINPSRYRYRVTGLFCSVPEPKDILNKNSDLHYIPPSEGYLFTPRHEWVVSAALPEDSSGTKAS